MTLIPLISAIVAAPEAITVPATAPALQPRGSYGADRTHHPFAALFAVGLPAALVVAVALSPMIVEDKPATVTPPWTSITLPKPKPPEPRPDRSEEHTSELQSLMRISYAVFCLKKKQK